MKIHNIRQRSAEWLALRRGIPTASQFDRIITPQGKRSGQARKYLYELAYEQLTERLWERNLGNIAHVQHGIDNEDRAVAAFEAHTHTKTAPIGFITNDAGTCGCSPDRLIVGRNEALEIKCPTGPVHTGYLIDGPLDAYIAQVQGEMLIGNFRCIHFFSWHPELPPYYRLVRPDPDFMALLQKYLEEFHAELILGVGRVRAMGSWPKNAPSVFPEEEDGEASEA